MSASAAAPDVRRVLGGLATLQASGLSPDAALRRLDHLVERQSVMLAPNELMAATACLFVLGALLTWIARRPMRQVELSQAGH